MCNACPEPEELEIIKALKAGAKEYAARHSASTVYLIHRTANNSYGYAPTRPTSGSIEIIDTLFFNQ